MSTPPSCKLEFIFAKKAKKAVIVRRGPSKWTQLILWFFEGEERSDEIRKAWKKHFRG
jgi:hypothetical protein